MKKAFSITLLALFIFQFIGYYFVYIGLRYQAKSEMITRLDTRAYSADETITLKIPFSLPYWMDSEDYQRIDGEFQYQGDFYKLVEQKLEKDTLYVVCIKDMSEKRLFNTMSDYVKLSNDMPSSSNQALKLLGSFIKDYVKSTQTEITLSLGWTLECAFEEPSFNLLKLAHPVSSPPPEHAG